ncbi:hypothetical protein F5148DRAFT_1285609 [Russula earlei]|uniref:Uncharacterized protein n=1 Tax=Russula earlei TaxID=71964 RepID=A0ACC0U5Z2_9AGAM|nr:hypothetical protein F5148DRAFT_1285609 [Russula earlei]
MSDQPRAPLVALTLSRALNSELSNTTQICFDHPTSSALASELAEAEALIGDTLRQVHFLKSHMLPVNRLPLEILTHIFGFLGGGVRVVPASHVCRKWRNVALSTPSLWTVIREDDEVFAAQSFLERSLNMPLDVSFRLDMRMPAKFRSFVAPHASRIARLHMHVFGDRVFDFYSLLATRDFVMPALERFSIRMSEYRFQDDSHDCVLPPSSFFPESESLTHLTFRSALPLQTHLSPAIRSLILSDRAFDLDALLGCLEAAPNLEFLALLNAVPYTFLSGPRSLVSLNRLRELHWFQVRVYFNVLGTVKFFEHLLMPALDTTLFVLYLDPTQFSIAHLYTPCLRHVSLFGAGTTTSITELQLEASHFTSGKPARNNIIFHGRRDHETFFSVRVHRGNLDSFCAPDPDGIALLSSVRVDLSHLSQLTLTSEFPYSWGRFFRTSWSRFLRSVPAINVLSLHVSRPIEIIAAIAAADSDELSSAAAAVTTASPMLPQLRVLRLFCCTRTGTKKGAAAPDTACAPESGICDEESRQVLLRFLRRRSDMGIPIQSIVCSAEDAAALPPAAVALVDSVEVGLPGVWAGPTFPGRMIPLLEEHLD